MRALSVFNYMVAIFKWKHGLVAKIAVASTFCKLSLAFRRMTAFNKWGLVVIPKIHLRRHLLKREENKSSLFHFFLGDYGFVGDSSSCSTAGAGCLLVVTIWLETVLILCFFFQIVATVGGSAGGTGCNYLHGSDNCGGVPPIVVFVNEHILLQIRS